MTCSSWGSGCSTPSSPSRGTASGSVGGGGANPPASEGGGAGAAAGGEAEVDISRLYTLKCTVKYLFLHKNEIIFVR